MKWLPQLLLFLVFFQIDVRVRAVGRDRLYEKPLGCSTGLTSPGLASPCLIQSVKSPVNLPIENFPKGAGYLQLATETLLLREAQGKIRFEEGALRVEGEYPSGKIFELNFLHGTLRAKSGAFSIRNYASSSQKASAQKKSNAASSPGRFLIANETAELTIVLRSGQTLDLPAGFEVWIGNLNNFGLQDYGMVQPWNWQNQVRLLNRFNMGTKDQRLEQGRLLKPISDLANQQAFQIYQKVADRHIASLAEQERRMEEKKQAERQARERLRQLFFDRTFTR